METIVTSNLIGQNKPINQWKCFIQLGADVYHQQVDFNGHYHGPNSEEVLRTIQELDGDISDLLKNITELGLSDIDVILLSDHGMAQIGDGHVIDISEILDMSEILEITEGGTETYIWPQKGKEGKVGLKLHVYK